MKTFEIFCLALMFILCFLWAEVMVDHLMIDNPFIRFVARVGFQLQLYGLVYLLFDSRDISRRLRLLEKHCNENTSDNEKEYMGDTDSKYEI